MEGWLSAEARISGYVERDYLNQIILKQCNVRLNVWFFHIIEEQLQETLLLKKNIWKIHQVSHEKKKNLPCSIILNWFIGILIISYNNLTNQGFFHRSSYRPLVMPIPELPWPHVDHESDVLTSVGSWKVPVDEVDHGPGRWKPETHGLMDDMENGELFERWRS